MMDWFESWKISSIEKFRESESFLKSLQKDRKDIGIRRVQEVHNEVFNKVDCLKCANCCRTTPPIVTKQDISRLAHRLNISKKKFLYLYVLEDITGEMSLNGVPCRFLNTDNSCRVYDVRPEACRRYPHTDEEGFFKRPGLNARNTLICPAAFHIVEQLKKISESI